MRDNPFHDFSPFPNQRENIQRLVAQRKALLCDKVGNGKTMSIIGAFGTLYWRDVVRWLVVFMPCNAYDKCVWQKDLSRFTTFRVKTLDEIRDLHDINDCDVLLCKHTHVKTDKAEIIKLMVQDPSVVLTIDEAHAFKNVKCQLTESMYEITKTASSLWMITGTTLSRDVEDTYWLLTMLNPAILGTFEQFRSTYCNTVQKIIGKYKNGAYKKALKITGLKNPELFHRVVDPWIITGSSVTIPHFKYVTYSMNEQEQRLYKAVANGIDVRPELSEEDWIKQCLSQDSPDRTTYIKSVEQFSSRFIYLQSCADGLLSVDGQIKDTGWSSKVARFLQLIDYVVSRGESIIVFVQYIETLRILKGLLEDIYSDRVNVYESSGSSKLKEGLVTEQTVKEKPCIILGSKASSESVSYYFINNVCFFQIPTVPHVWTQFVGRITRRNTLYPDSLYVWIMVSDNIDSYKLHMVGSKTKQMESVQGEEGNFPSDMKAYWNMDIYKKQLLWMKDKSKDK